MHRSFQTSLSIFAVKRKDIIQTYIVLNKKKRNIEWCNVHLQTTHGGGSTPSSLQRAQRPRKKGFHKAQDLSGGLVIKNLIDFVVLSMAHKDFSVVDLFFLLCTGDGSLLNELCLRLSSKKFQIRTLLRLPLIIDQLQTINPDKWSIAL